MGTLNTHSSITYEQIAQIYLLTYQYNHIQTFANEFGQYFHL